MSIKEFLCSIKLFEILAPHSYLYIGGSLPSYTLCPAFDKNKVLDVIGDIDIYTINSELLYVLIHNCVSDGIIVIKKRSKFVISAKFGNINLQFITSYFDNFSKEVLDQYDSDLVKIGYHLASDTYIYTDDYKNGLKNKKFNIIKKSNNEDRINKLISRITNWYNFDFCIKECEKDIFNFAAYNADECLLAAPLNDKTLFNYYYSSKYLQTLNFKFICIFCKKQISKYLICRKCIKIIYKYSEHNDCIYCGLIYLHYSVELKANNNHNITQKNIFILGGASGIGETMANRLMNLNNNVYRTTASKYKARYNKDMHHLDLYDIKYSIDFNRFDIIILNAFKTVSSSDNSWNLSLLEFDEDVLKDRIDCNVTGYVKLLQQIIKCKINNNCRNEPTILVFMDANESKYEDKMADGKHLEINMVKSAVKQIFYTNSNLLASLNTITICYDPGWISYHGALNIHNDTEFNNLFIDSQISMSGLFYYIDMVIKEFSQLMEKKTYIMQRSVYDYLNYIELRNNKLHDCIRDAVGPDLANFIINEIESNEIEKNDIKKNDTEKTDTDETDTDETDTE